MSERTSGAEGDPGGFGRQDPARRAPYLQGGPPLAPSTESAAVGVVRRLQARLDDHLARLENLYPEPTGRPELLAITTRMRRDTESLLLLSGEDPGGRSSGPRRLTDLLDDAASAAEETWRVMVRPAAAATVAPAAAVEFVHVLAEVVDHVTAVYPQARVDVASYVDARTGVTVEVSVNGAAGHDPDGLGGRRAMAAAVALAQRAQGGITLHRPPGGPPPLGSGLVASVSCPAAAVTIEEPAWSAVVAGGHSSFRETNGNGSAHGNGNGAGRPSALLAEPVAPPRARSVSGPVDELFGPMVDLPEEPAGDRFDTPIFEAIASAWFREEQAAAAGRDALDPDVDPLDWESPSDGEWREATARAARPDPEPSTASGLPRRRPGDQLVPPPQRRAEPESEPAERVPDRVRDRLSTYQRGLRHGRHRAPGPDTDAW